MPNNLRYLNVLHGCCLWLELSWVLYSIPISHNDLSTCQTAIRCEVCPFSYFLLLLLWAFLDLFRCKLRRITIHISTESTYNCSMVVVLGDGGEIEQHEPNAIRLKPQGLCFHLPASGCLKPSIHFPACSCCCSLWSMKELQELRSQTEIMFTFQSESGTFPSLKHPSPIVPPPFLGCFFFLSLSLPKVDSFVSYLTNMRDKKRADLVAAI